MFKAIFYIMGIVFAYLKHRRFVLIPQNVRKSIETENKPKEKQVIVVKGKYSDLPIEQREALKEGLISILFFFWLIVGLLTFNWIFYAGLLLFGLVIVNPIVKIFKNNVSVRIFISQIYIIITWILCFFVALNSYYLKIDSNQVINFFTYGK